MNIKYEQNNFKYFFFVNKTSLMHFLGIYYILVSSTCSGCYVHPSSGGQLCTGGKVQYMCACSVCNVDS